MELHDATAAESSTPSNRSASSARASRPGHRGRRDGVDTPGLVVNPSGGLVGRGHPLGATGLAQVVELATQLARPRRRPSGRRGTHGRGHQHRGDHLRGRRVRGHPRRAAPVPPRRGIRITGWGIAVPDKVVTNDDLAVTLDTSDEWIVERTGIKERHIGGTTSGLAIEAAQAALARAGRTADEIDNLGLATTTPDCIVPGTARPCNTASACTGRLRPERGVLGFRLRPDHRAGLVAWARGRCCWSDPRRCRASRTWTTARSP